MNMVAAGQTKAVVPQRSGVLVVQGAHQIDLAVRDPPPLVRRCTG
jgi:proline racemase